MLAKLKKNWTLWRVYSYAERQTEPLGCYIPFVSRQKSEMKKSKVWKECHKFQISDLV